MLPASDPLLLQVASDDILFGVVTAIHPCTCLFLPWNVGAVIIDVTMYWLPMVLPPWCAVLKASGHCTETNRIFGCWHLMERAPSNTVDTGLMIFIHDNGKFKVWQRTAYREFVQLLNTADFVFFWVQINTLILNASVFAFEGELLVWIRKTN